MRTFKNVLVTGGAGFIGSHLVRHLNQTTDWKITVMDSLTYAGNLENIEDCKWEFAQIDIRDKWVMQEFFTDNKFDAIIHLAAESHVDNSIANPEIFIETNIIGTVNLLTEALKLHKENPDFMFYHVSTDEVFGSLSLLTSRKFDETTAYDPRSPYSASKASSDHFVRAYHATYGLPILISNCSNNYGTHQYPEKLIPVIVNKLINRESLPVYGTGDNIRDWLYVGDHCTAIKSILESGVNGQTYCIGSKDLVNNLDLVKMICEIYDRLEGTTDSESLITFVEDRKGHDKKYAINFTKLSRQLGWEPKMGIEQGLEETVAWYCKSKVENEKES